MKISSILIMSVTLFVFYNLAVFQQNTRNHKTVMDAISPAEKEHTYSQSIGIKTALCMEGRVSNKHFTEIEAHHISEDEFAMEVLGKDHRYLNTGISFIAPAEKSCSSYKIARTNKDPNPQKTNLSGS